MSRGQWASAVLVGLVVVGCRADGATHKTSTPRPTRAAARDVVVRSWPSAGLRRVVLRAGAAPEGTVVVREGDTVEVSGRASGGAAGYHSSDPNWKETQAADWGLDFEAKRFGDVLVISTKNEMSYIHHHYALEDVKVSVPAGIEVVRVRRELSGQGAPDLSEPQP
jgi:hypothetical protein